MNRAAVRQTPALLSETTHDWTSASRGEDALGPVRAYASFGDMALVRVRPDAGRG